MASSLAKRDYPDYECPQDAYLLPIDWDEGTYLAVPLSDINDPRGDYRFLSVLTNSNQEIPLHDNGKVKVHTAKLMIYNTLYNRTNGLLCFLGQAKSKEPSADGNKTVEVLYLGLPDQKEATDEQKKTVALLLGRTLEDVAYYELSMEPKRPR